jgi:hypothetical protein
MTASGLTWPNGDSEEEMQLNEARASLFAGHVELIDAQPLTSTSVKLVWEVRFQFQQDTGHENTLSPRIHR